MSRNTSRTIIIPTTLKTLTKSMLAISLSVAGMAHAELYSSVTFFGDSLTDGGYFSPITKDIYGLAESGQFTTNPDNTWATSFAEQLGTTSVANTYDGSQTGNNYSIGGARAGEETVQVFPTSPTSTITVDVASTNSQVNNYLANNRVDPNGLYVVWAGANDLSVGAGDAAVVSQIETVQALKNNGAKYILVPNIPDLGLTPRAIDLGPGTQQFLTSN
ncbi:MAG TPA: SGNH/GDSL hydrolase family protein, partial [Psychrobacter sp.]|uniref:SGNH/GDSL hydrolase family protein n=1 Tax=Psychrobacter sp. TaxID=56811 RepID=UPI002C9CF45F